jgi:hypothetical protein
MKLPADILKDLQLAADSAKGDLAPRWHSAVAAMLRGIADDINAAISTRGCGVPPQAVAGASRPVPSAP